MVENLVICYRELARWYPKQIVSAGCIRHCIRMLLYGDLTIKVTLTLTPTLTLTLFIRMLLYGDLTIIFTLTLILNPKPKPKPKPKPNPNPNSNPNSNPNPCNNPDPAPPARQAISVTVLSALSNDLDIVKKMFTNGAIKPILRLCVLGARLVLG